MSADGTNSRTLAASIDIKVGGQAAPTGRRTAPGSWPAAATRRVRDCSRSPWTAVRPFGSSRSGGQSVWSPDGDLIVYAGPFVGGQVPLLVACRPDGTPVRLPRRAGPPGRRIASCPTEQAGVPAARRSPWTSGCSISPRRTTRQLTRLGDQGAVQTFDITPDGKYIVFDRSRENSDIVLIDLPRSERPAIGPDSTCTLIIARRGIHERPWAARNSG